MNVGLLVSWPINNSCHDKRYTLQIIIIIIIIIIMIIINASYKLSITASDFLLQMFDGYTVY